MKMKNEMKWNNLFACWQCNYTKVEKISDKVQNKLHCNKQVDRIAGLFSSVHHMKWNEMKYFIQAKHKQQ